MPIDLAKLAADLREAKRYVRRDPDEAIRQTQACIAAMGIWTVQVNLNCLCGEWQTVQRLFANLKVGIKFVRSWPQGLECYLATAAFEADVLAATMKNEVEEVSQ